MAQNTAQYEALQYTSQAPVFDYGSITRGVGDIVEKKRLEDEAKARELESQKTQLIKDYGDEIYSTFELTGLDNVDQIGLETKTLILDRAESINKMLTNGQITSSEANRMMMMAKNQSKKANEYISGLSTYAEQIREKGENASPSDTLKLERINTMYQEGVSVGMDSKGNIMFISPEDGKMVPSPFSKASGYTTFSSNIKPDSVLEAVMKDSATNEYYGKEGIVWTSKLGKNNKLTGNQRSAFKEYVGKLSGEDLYDLAVNSGLDVPKPRLDGELRLENEQLIKDGIVTKLEEQAQLKYGNKALDEKTGNIVRAQLYKTYKNDEEPKVSTPKKTKDGRDLYTLDTSNQKPLSYSFKRKREEGFFGPMGREKDDYANFKINSYVPSQAGKPGLVSITHTVKETGLDYQGKPVQLGYRTVTEDITIADQNDEEWVKTQVNIKTPEEVITPSGNNGDKVFQ